MFKVGIGVGAVSCIGILPSIVCTLSPTTLPFFSWLNAATPKRLQAASKTMDWRRSNAKQVSKSKFARSNFQTHICMHPKCQTKTGKLHGSNQTFCKSSFCNSSCTSWDVVPTNQASLDFNGHALSCPSRLQGTYLFSWQAPQHVASTWSKALAWGMTRPPHYRSAPFRNHSRILTLQNLLVKLLAEKESSVLLDWNLLRL